jgi:hypothetical protein
MFKIDGGLLLFWHHWHQTLALLLAASVALRGCGGALCGLWGTHGMRGAASGMRSSAAQQRGKWHARQVACAAARQVACAAARSMRYAALLGSRGSQKNLFLVAHRTYFVGGAQKNGWIAWIF